MSKNNFILVALLGIVLIVGSKATAQESGVVAKSAFTTEIVDREPVNDLDSVSTDIKQIYFFTDIRNMSGNRVTHRWLHSGETRAEVSFNVGGPRWRVHSSKNLAPEWVGDWTVEVVDSSGSVIHKDSFVYSKGTGMMETAPATESQPEMKTETTPATESQPEMKTETAPATESQPEMKTETAPTMTSGEGFIAKGVFTTEVVDRDPVDEIDSLYTDVKKLFFFTDIRNMEGKTVLHRWMHGGVIRAEVSFEVGGPRWRVYSSKNLTEERLGNWKAEVLDSEGNRLYETEFVYLKRK